MFMNLYGVAYAGSALFGTLAAVTHQAQEADPHQQDGGRLWNWGGLEIIQSPGGSITIVGICPVVQQPVVSPRSSITIDVADCIRAAEEIKTDGVIIR